MKLLLRLASILFLSALVLEGSAQTFPPKLTVFEPSEYNGHGQVFSIEAFPDGRIAFGSNGGIHIFDGEHFREYELGAGKAVFAIERGPKGRLFVGGESLMGYVAPDSTGTLKYQSLLPLLPDSLHDFGTIWGVKKDGKGGVYFNSLHKLFYLQDLDSISTITPKARFFTIHSLHGSLIIEDRSDGLYRLKEEKKTFVGGSTPLTEGKGIRAVLPAPDEERATWTVFTLGGGFFKFDPKHGEITHFPEEKHGEANARELQKIGRSVYCATHLDPERNLYGAAYAVGTRSMGLYLLSAEGEVLFHLDREHGLPSKFVWDVLPDGEGNLWVTTNQGLAFLHTGQPFSKVKEGKAFDGAVSDIGRFYTSRKKDSLSSGGERSPLFIGTAQGMWSWDEEAGTFTRSKGMGGNCLNFLSYPFGTDKDGAEAEGEPSLLIAAAHKGLLQAKGSSGKDGGAMELDQVYKGHSYDLTLLPKALAQDEKDRILVGGRGNLAVLKRSSSEKGGWEKCFRLKKAVPEGIISTGWDTVDTRGDSIRLWAGMSSKGLLEVSVPPSFSGYHIEHYDTTDGLPKGSAWIYERPQGGGVLFGTRKGLYSYEAGNFRPHCAYGEELCDGSRKMYRFKGGVGGEVWYDDGEGAELKHLLPQKEGYRVDSLVFRALDIGVRTLFPEEKRTWIAGDKGVACYYPDMKKDLDPPWDCRIRRVRGAGDSLLFGGVFGERSDDTIGDSLGKGWLPMEEQPESMIPTLPYAKNRMFFRFSAFYPDRQDKVRYRYKLKGFDKSWSEPTKKTEKEYTNLPEGSYNFKVKARNVYLKESSTAEYRFRILPPWYRTWAAYGAYSVAGIGLIWLLLWLNSRRLVAQKQRLERIVDERTREIREQQKETEKQKEEVEKQKQEVEQAHEKLEEAHASLEESHREITASIDYAQKIQHALLQSEEYVSGHLPEHFILFKPQATVSGDFYWAKELEGHLYFAAVDCTGHGVPGAFMSMLGINQLNEIMAAKEFPTPGEVLTELRERVVAELSSGNAEGGAKDGMDAAMVRIPLTEGHDPKPGSKKIEFAGANNPLYVVKEGIGEAIPDIRFKEGKTANVGTSPDLSPADELTDRVKPFNKSPDGFEVKGDKMAVGYEPDAAEAFTTAELEVPSDAMLYLFSDGYADQFGGTKGKKFRYGPFKELLARVHTMKPEEQKAELDRIFEEWKGEQEQVDDVCVVGVRV